MKTTILFSIRKKGRTELYTSYDIGPLYYLTKGEAEQDIKDDAVLFEKPSDFEVVKVTIEPV